MTESAYARWRSQPFPRSSADDDNLDELNKDLAYWDAMVADTIIPVVENGSPYDAGGLELRQGLVECRRKLVAASQLSASVDAAMIAQNLVYLDLLIAANDEVSSTS